MPDCKQVLVQDDEFPLREIMSRLLIPKGYKCRLAETAEQTLQTLRSRKNIDLVICGILEWSDGQFNEMVERFPDIPVIVCTGTADGNVLRRALRLGAYDFLLKPFEGFELFSLVARALDHSNLRLENRSLRAKLKSPANRRTFRLSKSR
jgi:DNA-binding NtrC family response regulator